MNSTQQPSPCCTSKLIPIVMPYVEGETLRDRIDREHQLPVDDAVRIATNVAEAIDYAHSHGVIHRDIKPANILLQAGKPVISDFGIALAVGVAGGGRLTETGLSVGTPHYMSPEQATGDLSVGGATDIYALGCVLYEMLVGEPPYTGSTAQAILGKIIAGKLASATEERASVPANVDAAIRKALEKLPADRFTSAQEFMRALGDPGFRHGEEIGVRVGGWPGLWNPLSIGATGVAALALVLGIWSIFRPEPPGPVTRFTLTPPSEVTIGAWRGFAVSPDGRTTVFADDLSGQLYRQEVGQLDPVLISGTQNARKSFFSPDGEWVGYFDVVEDALKKTRLDGSGAQTLAQVGGLNQNAGWGPDGTIVLHSSLAEGLWRIRDTGGELERIPNTEAFRELLWLDVLPNGQAVLTQTLTVPWQVVAISLETGEPKVLFPGSSPRYVSTGHVIFWLEDALWAVPFDPERLTTIGQLERIVEKVGAESGTGRADFAVGGNLLFYDEREGYQEPVPLWLDRGALEQLLDPALAGFIGPMAISPNGRLIAFEYSPTGPRQEDIWIYDLEQETLSRLTFGGSRNINPFWAPDGTEVGFSSDRTGFMALYARAADLSGDARLVLADPGDGLYEGSWTPEGRRLLYRRGTSSTSGSYDLWYTATDPDSTPVVILDTPEIEANLSLSPDGRWLAYVSEESGQREVYVRPFPGPGGRSPVSTNGGHNPVWAHNGREIFYLDASNYPPYLTVATVRIEPDFAVESRKRLFSWGASNRWAANDLWWDVSPDDQRILLLGIPGDSDSREAGSTGRYVVVQNFFEELRQVVGN